MKTNKIIIALLVTLALVGIVNALDVQKISPASNAVITADTHILTANITSINANDNATNCSFYYDRWSSGTYTLIGKNDTGTDKGGLFNLSYIWTTSTLTDGNYTINVTCINSTGLGRSNTTTHVVIDRGNPTASIAAPANNVDYDDGDTITFTSATDASLRSCTLYVSTDGQWTTYAITAASSVCTQDISTLDRGTHEYYFIGYDGYEQTTGQYSNNQFLKVESGRGVVPGIKQEITQEIITASRIKLILLVFALIGLLSLIIYSIAVLYKKL